MSADRGNTQNGGDFTIDVSTIFETLRDMLRTELLAELRADLDATAWPEFMEIRTAARYVDAPVERLRKLVARRKIPYHQEAPGCRISFARRDLDTWMSSSRHEQRQR